MPRAHIAPTLLGCALAGAIVLAGPSPAATPEVTYQRAAFKATNAERTDRDLVALKKQKCLQKRANRQARRMVDRALMFHQDVAKMLHTCHLSWAGENVAYGFQDGPEVVEAWMSSPGHRANILRPGDRLMAIAARQTRLGVWYVAQVFGTR